MPLRGIGARLVERIDFRQVIVNSAIWELAEMHSRDFVKAFRSIPRNVANTNGCPDFMSSPTEPSQGSHRVFHIDRFAEHVTIDCHQGIGRQNHSGRRGL